MIEIAKKVLTNSKNGIIISTKIFRGAIL